MTKVPGLNQVELGAVPKLLGAKSGGGTTVFLGLFFGKEPFLSGRVSPFILGINIVPR